MSSTPFYRQPRAARAARLQRGRKPLDPSNLEAKLAGLSDESLRIIKDELGVLDIAKRDWLRARLIMSLRAQYDHETLTLLFRSTLSAQEIAAMHKDSKVDASVLEMLGALNDYEGNRPQNKERKVGISRQELQKRLRGQ